MQNPAQSQERLPRELEAAFFAKAAPEAASPTGNDILRQDRLCRGRVAQLPGRVEELKDEVSKMRQERDREMEDVPFQRDDLS